MDRFDIHRATSANKAAWEASAHLHGSGQGWESLLAAAAEPGFSVFDTCITETLKSVGVAGRRAAQLGCNNARELLSLASMGAHPELGIDQSSRFLAQGALLANAAGLNPRLLAANIYDLPEDVEAFTYDGTDGGSGATGYRFIHTLGDIVTACVRSGLKLQSLTEHPHLNREVEYAVYENQKAQIPLSYTLTASA